MADIPEIVMVVVNSLPHAGPVMPSSTQSSKRTTRTANHFSPKNGEQPGQSPLQHSSDFEEEGDKNPYNEDFGKSMHAMWYCHVYAVLIHTQLQVARCSLVLFCPIACNYQ